MKPDTEKPAAPAEPDEGEEPTEIDPFALPAYDPAMFRPGYDPVGALDAHLGSLPDEMELKADLLHDIASKRARRKYD